MSMDDDTTPSDTSSQHIIPLWPCPMCGSEANFTEHIEEMVWTAECSLCGLSLGYPFGYASRLDLCKDWNRRFPIT
jgi:transcription elongation factor Elf1